MTADGTSNNIDGYAEKKFEALKEYGELYPEIKWGFVRAVGTQLYISNTIWTEDMTNHNVWKPIEAVINNNSIVYAIEPEQIALVAEKDAKPNNSIIR